MRVAGLAVGNVLGAYLYFHHQDFSLLSMFSTVFTLIGIRKYLNVNVNGLVLGWGTFYFLFVL